MAVPKSTAMHAAAEALVGRHGVHETIGPQLARVVDPDGHPGLIEGPTSARAPRGSAPHLLVLLSEAGTTTTRSPRPCRGAAGRGARGRPASTSGQLVGGRLPRGGEAPVLDRLLAAEHAHMGLGVADVDREQHERAIIAAARRSRPQRRCSASRRRLLLGERHRSALAARDAYAVGLGGPQLGLEHVLHVTRTMADSARERGLHRAPGSRLRETGLTRVP